ncbi:MAG TPA: 2Fe-2S iron-sulfur cluster-binding protein, partial [Candidatus Competibacteraceae bacterium]|nr:2Fe-2S iron-sulfur cluster-binding protein [Candidatus Competibacteraceae bacterium]
MLAGRLRLASGLTLFAFLTCHLLNHAFGLASIEAMGRAHVLLLGPWRTLPGTVLLTSALVTHLGCAMRAIYRRRTLRLPPWEWLQLGLGLILPWLILEHVLNTRIAELVLGPTPSYARVIAVLWISAPPRGLLQAVAVVVAWGHGCVGLYLWLRTKTGFPRWRWWLAPLALLLPTLALAGYVAAGFEMREELSYPQRLATLLQPPPAAAAAWLQGWALMGYALLAALLAAPFLGRGLRRVVVRWCRLPQLILSDGRRLPIVPGASVLEVLRSYGVPHASVCGGRARCTTCRVRVLQGAEALPAPSGDEAAALARIHAPPGVRLACQIRPQHDLAIAALLPPGARAADGRTPGGMEGHEQAVTCMFVDLR